MKPLHVCKVGGSLFDVPDLGARLNAWIGSRPAERILVIPGGGAAADLVRRLQPIHGLNDPRAHWLGVRSMSFTACLLAELLGLPVVTDLRAEHAIFDVYRFVRADGALPSSWDVTSDSIAARVAQVHRGRLTLFKSVDLPAGMTWAQAAAAGLVDRAFPTVAVGLQVDWINLRAR